MRPLCDNPELYNCTIKLIGPIREVIRVKSQELECWLHDELHSDRANVVMTSGKLAGSNSIWPFLSPQFKTCFKSWLNSGEHCARLLEPKWTSSSLLDYCSPYLVWASKRKLPYCATTTWYHGWELHDSRGCVLFFVSHASETLPVTTKVNNLTYPHSQKWTVKENIWGYTPHRQHGD